MTDLIKRLRVNAPQAESSDQAQTTVPADPRAAVEQAIVETLRRERGGLRYERHPAR
ncbi:MAG TPA: hypothetical protein VIK69_10390 [Methylophilaceae bacterium]